MKRATERAHEAVAAVVGPGEVVVDATVGNGHDTLFLARCVGLEGTVYGFDLQAEALEATRRRLLEAGDDGAGVRLIRGGHETIRAHVQEPVAAVMFNLGYLPGGDHGITTQAGSTLEALVQAAALLRPGGVISVVCYRGHDGAEMEAEAVCEWAHLNSGGEFRTMILGRDDAERGPFLVLLSRR